MGMVLLSSEDIATAQWKTDPNTGACYSAVEMKRADKSFGK